MGAPSDAGPAPPGSAACVVQVVRDSVNNGQVKAIGGPRGGQAPAATVAAPEVGATSLPPAGAGAGQPSTPAALTAAVGAPTTPLTPDAARRLAAAGWPFLDVDHPVTWLTLLHAVAALPRLALRACLVALCMPFVTAVAGAAVAGRPPGEPLPAWRAALIRPFLAWWARFLLRWGWACVPTVTGLEHVAGAEAGTEGGRAVIVLNHCSFLDGLAVAGLLHAPSAVAKAGVADVPGFGAFARALQCVFVSRGAGSGDGEVGGGGGGAPARPSAAAAAGPAGAPPPPPPAAGGGRGAAAAIAARVADGRFPPVAVAPEGTTKPGACLLRFRTGAFVAGAPVLPVLLSYGGEGRVGAPPRPAFHPGWGVLASGLAHFARSQAAPATRLAVRVLPVYRPSPAEAGDPALFAENVRHHMAAALGVPPVDVGLEEWAALKAAGICTDAGGRRVLWRPGGQGGRLVELPGGVEAVRAAAAAAGVVGGAPPAGGAWWSWLGGRGKTE